MNKDIFKGNWKQLRGAIEKQWGKLTDDDLDIIDGELDKLVGQIQERYGWNREEAERKVTDFFDRQTSDA